MRVFGASLTQDLHTKFQHPKALFSHLSMHLGAPRYFLGGGGTFTQLHYDREWNKNWHLVLDGKRRIVLFTVDKSTLLKKLPFTGSTVGVNDGHREVCGNESEGYACVLRKGDLLYMPEKAWHLVEYPEWSIAVTFAFYTSKHTKVLGPLHARFFFGLSAVGQLTQTRPAVFFLLLPLVGPLALFMLLYAFVNHSATVALGACHHLVTLPMFLVECILFIIYYPLMLLMHAQATNV